MHWILVSKLASNLLNKGYFIIFSPNVLYKGTDSCPKSNWQIIVYCVFLDGNDCFHKNNISRTHE